MEQTSRKKAPKYIELANQYRRLIQDGIYKSGDTLPDERTLSMENGVDRRTVRRAFDILQHDGLVHKIIGSGVYVGGREEGGNFPRAKNFGTYPVIGVVAPEVSESDTTKSIEHAIVKNIVKGEYEALRINYLTQAELKSRLMHYHDFLRGLIFIGNDLAAITANAKYAISKNIPVVVAGLVIPVMPSDMFCDCLFLDEEKSAREVVKYLVDAGHRHIVLAGCSNMVQVKKHGRYVGFMAAMSEYRLKPLVAIEKSLKPADFGFYSISFQLACGAKLAEQLMAKRKRPTAVVCLNDHIGLGFIDQLKKMNISYPKDIEVFGFGNTIMRPEIYINVKENPLSSAGADFREISSKAVDMLMRRIRDPEEKFKTEYVPYGIIHRQSTGGNNNK